MQYNDIYFTLTVYVQGKNVYTATFMADGNIVGIETFTASNLYVTEPKVPERIGQVGKWQEYTLSNQDITIYATYELKKYKIGLDYNGADTVCEESIQAEYECLIPYLPTPTKNGYKFAGWYYGETLIDAYSAGISMMKMRFLPQNGLPTSFPLRLLQTE